MNQEIIDGIKRMMDLTEKIINHNEQLVQNNAKLLNMCEVLFIQNTQLRVELAKKG